MKTTTHREVKTFTHKDIAVTVLIDYDKGTVSIVEKNYDSWKPKKYTFCHRTLDYMNGWLNVLEAMQEAIKEAKKLLEKDLEEKSRINEEKIIEMYATPTKEA